MGDNPNAKRGVRCDLPAILARRFKRKTDCYKTLLFDGECFWFKVVCVTSEYEVCDR
jgi:hypothetical protein